MTTKALATFSICGVILSLGACASPEPLAPTSEAAPPQTAPQLRQAEPAGSPAQSTNAPSRPPVTAPAAKSPHRQYLDQRTGRYYYFDMTSHRYYWEDGTPRY